jgi:hypothetical protein
MFKLQEKLSALKRNHPALQKMKFIKCFWVIFAHLDRGPDCESGAPGSGSRDPIESGTDRDPQQWFVRFKIVENFLYLLVGEGISCLQLHFSNLGSHNFRLGIPAACNKIHQETYIVLNSIKEIPISMVYVGFDACGYLNYR